jgi:Tfp pilus assembly protein PilF
MDPNLQRAQLLIQQRRYADAQRLLGQSLGSDSDNPWTHALLGVCLAHGEQFTEATDRAHEAIAMAPDSAPIRVIAAQVALMRNDLDAATRLAGEAIALDPTDERPYTIRASANSQRKHWADCLEDAQRALAIDPDDTTALNLQSMANRGLGRTEASTFDIRQALRSDPEDPYTHNNAGWASLRSGDYKQAEVHFREALRLDPSLESARIGVLETAKAKFPAYRWFLAMMLRLHLLSAGKQFALLVGLWIGARVLGAAAEKNSAVAMFAIPILVAYAALCVATWFWRPLSNAALLFHPFARMALTGKEKLEAALVVATIVFQGGLIIASLAYDSDACFLLAQSTLAPLLAIVFSFQMEHPKPRRILLIAAGLLALNSLLILSLYWGGEPLQSKIPKWVLDLVFGPMNDIRLWSPIIVLIGSQVLASRHWKRD